MFPLPITRVVSGKLYIKIEAKVGVFCSPIFLQQFAADING